VAESGECLYLCFCIYFFYFFYLTVKYNQCITKHITSALFSSLNLSMSGINSAAITYTFGTNNMNTGWMGAIRN